MIEEARLVTEHPFIGIPGVDAEAAKQVRRIARTVVALADRADQLAEVLRGCIRNDESPYGGRRNTHRSWDGKRAADEPGALKGARWATPRELATDVLRSLGIKVPQPGEQPPPQTDGA